MTHNEALDRARQIWPDVQKIYVSPRQRWTIETKTGVHVMDENGHPTCHGSCQRIEEKLI